MNVDFTNEHLSILNDSQESSNIMGISDDSQVSISLHSHSTLPIGGSGTILSETPSQSALAQEPTMPKRPHNVNISNQFIACLNIQNVYRYKNDTQLKTLGAFLLVLHGSQFYCFFFAQSSPSNKPIKK